METIIAKYQPRKFADFFPRASTTLDLIQSIITNNTSANRFSPKTFQLLITGESGCGKSVLLNAAISEYYGLNTATSTINENILIINSLKEQGIGFYRNDVRLFCQSQCIVRGKRKTLVIDDLDVVNEQGQQAIRNCIDKYNINVIATCTNVQKIIECLQSRLIIVKLPMPSLAVLKQVIQNVAKNEGVTIAEDALDFILNVSCGRIKSLFNYIELFRLLETTKALCSNATGRCELAQSANREASAPARAVIETSQRFLETGGDARKRSETSDKSEHGELLRMDINLELAQQLCTDIHVDLFKEYTLSLRTDLKYAIDLFYELYDKGYSVMDILNSYFQYIQHNDGCLKECNLTEMQKYEIITIICEYIAIFHTIHEDEIELAIFSNDCAKMLRT